MQNYEVGKRVCQPGPDGVFFNFTNGGGVLVIRMGRPTAEEKRAFKSGLSLRLAVAEDIIFVLCRMGTLQWMDAPYHRGMSPAGTELEPIADGMGYAIHCMLVDAHTGILVAQKLISTTTAGGRALREAMLAQPPLPDFDTRLQLAYAMYSTDDLVKESVPLC